MIEFDSFTLADDEQQPASDAADLSLRPKTFAEYIGQRTVREQMRIFVEAAKARNEALDHTLLYGPAGLGKTTLAYIIAHEMQVNIKITAAPMLTRPADLAALITNVEPYSVLFVDEIHRLSPVVEESLYPAMEDYRLDILVGEGAGARSIKIDVPPFTLVGATTRTGLLTAPLRDRFGIMQHLQFYDHEDLTDIVMRTADLLNCAVDTNAAVEIAQRSRGTPRIANKLLRRVRDYAQVKQQATISQSLAHSALAELGVDAFGLDALDHALLSMLVHNFRGGPVGVKTLAAALNEEPLTIEEVIEPYLLQNDFLQRTARGRVATEKSYQLLNVPFAKDRQAQDALALDQS